jgi:hypothetical protein
MAFSRLDTCANFQTLAHSMLDKMRTAFLEECSLTTRHDGRAARRLTRFAIALGALAVGAQLALSGLCAAALPVQAGTERWQLQHPSTTGQAAGALNGLSCVGAMLCTAVGTATINNESRAIAERWDHDSWTSMATPDLTSDSQNVLDAVSCRSATRCVAVGNATLSWGINKALAESWNGNRWSVVRSQSPNENSYLRGASCAATNVCLAVGYTAVARSEVPRALVERLDGSRWVVVPVPMPPGGHASLFNSVSCASASDCLAVGYVTRSGVSDTLVARWNGERFSILRSPDDGQLVSVSCPAPERCVAIGSPWLNGEGLTLSERWIGSTFKALVAPRYPHPNDVSGLSLSDLWCASLTSCLAVGGSWGGAAAPLIQQLSGSRWAVDRSVVPTGAEGSALRGVSCSGAVSCEAVGYAFQSAGSGTLLALRGTR